MSWENAYTPFATDTGEMALPPDNQFHQLTLSGGYQISDLSRLNADIAIGRMEQNENLLAATTNSVDFPALSVASGDSVNAEVDTTNAKIKYISSLTDKLRLKANYNYSDRDNKTPGLLYDWVITDGFLAPQRTNQPYSIRQTALNIGLDYQVARGSRYGIGYDLESKKETFQDVEKTDENTLWGSVRIRSTNKAYLNFKLSRSERDSSASQSPPLTDPPQNILHSKYNTADRSRNSAGMQLNLMPQAEYSIGLGMDISRDAYDNSILGLVNAREHSINGDVSVMISEITNLNFFIGEEKIKSTQSGRQSFPALDWSAINDDNFINIGFGVTHVLIENKLDIGADFTQSSSTGEVVVRMGSRGPVFPEIKTDLETIRVYANYRLDEVLTLRAVYWHESYESSDWMLDDIAADTVPGLLSLGESSPGYSNNVIKVALQYRF